MSHTKKTYVSNDLNEFAWSQVLSDTYNFKNVSPKNKKKKNYEIRSKYNLEYDEGYWIQIAKILETQLDHVVYKLTEIDKVT